MVLWIKEVLTRLAFSDDDKSAREFLVNLMKNAGLKVRIDSVGKSC